jgi:signal transduction histidine kinase
MKIVPKLTLALMAGTCVVLSVNGLFRVRREVAAFEADRLRDHEMIGRSLSAAASAAWKADGESAARATVEAVNTHFSRIHIAWLAAGAPSHLGRGVLESATGGEPITRAVRDENGPGSWYTYVPVDVDGVRRGALELVEAADAEERFASSVLAEAARATLMLALLSAVLSFVMGQWLVGAPVRKLVDKARRIGQGDFSGPVALDQDDELSALATEMNAMCERLVATLAQLRHADRLATVGKLASGIAHELGTPLNVVSARAGMIAGDTTLDESREYARVIGTAAERMTRIIQQLLQFARRKDVQKTTRDVQALARDTLELLRPLAAKQAVELRIVPPSADTSLAVDAGQLQQVVTNLVMNAIQATGKGGRVELEWYDARERGEAEFLCLDVRDDGEGIKSEHVARIFEPFFTTKDVGEGTGLGLAVSYGIVRDHGGRIAVATELDKGTTFTVFLPRMAS